MSKTVELYTAVNEAWTDEHCLEVMKGWAQGEAPWINSVNDLQTDYNNSRVIKLTFEVLDQNVGELREDKQHRN